MTTVAADVTIYAEKVLKDSRHIEVQILADTFGDVVHFIETDGTIQRNCKKIIQVSPGISLDRCVSTSSTSKMFILMNSRSYLSKSS